MATTTDDSSKGGQNTSSLVESPDEGRKIRVTDRDVEANGQIDNGANSSHSNTGHANQVYLTIVLGVVALASQYDQFLESSIFADVAHVLFLSTLGMGLTTGLCYALGYGHDGDGVCRYVMICSMSTMLLFMFGHLSMTWAVRTIPVAVCVTIITMAFCGCLGLVVRQKVRSIRRNK